MSATTSTFEITPRRGAPPGAGRSDEDGAAVVETHTAVLVFIGDRVHKLKKPVDLGFVDFTRREQREEACRAEVELNRRLAPDVYLGVEDVIGIDGAVSDHLVAMRRLPADRRLSTMVRRGEDVGTALDEVAAQIAGLHRRTPPDPAWHHVGEVEAQLAIWREGAATVAPLLDTDRDRARWADLTQLAGRYLEGRRRLLEARIAAGRVRDGHGDLQADDTFLLDDGPRILDALEFDPRYRWGDGLADAAFLAMDLERLGRRDLADRFLDAYGRAADDRWPPSLAHHAIAQRAQVRAKVGILRSAQTGRPDPGIDALVDLALDHLRAAQVRLVLVGGLPGVGKSTLAAGLARSLDAAVPRSDELRPALAGTGDRYDRHTTDLVYRAMIEDARPQLELGRTVVLDATWADPRHRRRARSLAAETGSIAVELACCARPDLAASRIRARLAAGGDLSEATPEIAVELAARFAPWPEATAIDTSGRPEVACRAARTMVDGARPAFSR